MEKRRAFSLIEILAVIAVLAVIASIAYPTFARIQRAGRRSVCVSNLQQIGRAISMYRADWNGGEAGTPAQVGLPSLILGGLPTDGLRCTGDAGEGKMAGYNFEYPDPAETSKRGTEAAKTWSEYVGKYGSMAMIVVDPNHQDSMPRSWSWQSWTALDLRLDGSIATRTRLGYPKGYGWWHP